MGRWDDGTWDVFRIVLKDVYFQGLVNLIPEKSRIFALAIRIGRWQNLK